MEADTKMKWEGRWDQLKGKLKETWGQLTDDDVDIAEGEFDQLIGRVAERTGETSQKIRRQIDSF